MDKRSSWLRKFVNYGEKKFYNIGPRSFPHLFIFTFPWRGTSLRRPSVRRPHPPPETDVLSWNILGVSDASRNGRCQKQNLPQNIWPGSTKANGRAPKTGLGRVFNLKLGCFDDAHILIYVDACPHLYLKTRPRFSPVSLSLSIIWPLSQHFIYFATYEWAP